MGTKLTSDETKKIETELADIEKNIETMRKKKSNLTPGLLRWM